MKPSGVALLLVLLAIIARTAAAEPMSLQTAVELALRNHPVIARDAASNDSAVAQIGEARVPLLPVVNLSGSGAEEYNDPIDLLSSKYGGFQNTVTYSATLAVTQLVTDFGLTRYQVAGAKANAVRARAQVAVDHLDIELGVVQAYLQIQQNQELLAISVGAIGLVNEQLARATALFKATIKPELDVLSAKTQLAQAELQRLNDDYNVSVAQITLQNAIGVTQPRVTEVSPIEIVALPDEAKAAGALTAASLAERPEITGLKAGVEGAESKVDVGKVRNSPVVTVEGGLVASGTYMRNSMLYPSAIPGGGPFAALVVSWDLYRGSNNTYEIRDAQAQVRSAQSELERESQAIQLSVSNAALSVRLSAESYTVAQGLRVQAQRQIQLAQNRYQTGVGNFVELNDARTTLVNAQRGEVTAKYNLAQSRLSLARELGRAPASLASPAHASTAN